MGAPAPIKPPALRPGDTVGVIAPASTIKPELLRDGYRELESLGFRPRARGDIAAAHRYNAGTLERRREEFQQMLEDPEVRAVWAARGGYGSGHLLPFLSADAIRKHPKVLCGASDITMLLAAYLRAGVVAFHAPMVATTLRRGAAAYERDLLVRMLVGGEAVQFSTEGCEALGEGRCEGRLTGGCLSLVVSTLGTPWEIDTTDAILVFEDIDARPYQIDRMLTHLKQAGKLESARGFVFGEMLGCRQHPDQGYTVQEVIASVLEDLRVPVLFGFPTGHSSKPNAIVPFGVRARLSLENTPRFELLEPAVESNDG